MDVTSSYIGSKKDNWQEYYEQAKGAWGSKDTEGTVIINNSHTNCIEFYDGPQEPFAYLAIEGITQESFEAWWIRVWGNKNGVHSPCMWKRIPTI